MSSHVDPKTRLKSVSDALLGDVAYAKDSQKRPMLNAAFGGQQGWAPNLAEWVANQNYVTRPLVCILLQAPKVFEILPNPEKWTEALKGLFELHARSIEGFSAGLKVNVADTPVGGGGEIQQEFVNVTRERSSPTFTFDEKYGRPTQQFFDYWIRYGMMDPETKFAMAGVLTGSRPNDLLADWYTATCLFFEPDPLHNKIQKSWITTNMFPQGNGEITAKRDLTSDQELLSLQIEFTGLSVFGKGVDDFAQKILDKSKLDKADPFMREAVWGIESSDVQAAEKGYLSSIETIGTLAVTSLN
jgi:hypothetical protein